MTPATSAGIPLLDADEINELLKAGSAMRLKSTTQRSLHAGRSGEFAGRREGSGLDFAETRRFGEGDNARQINWRTSARSGELQVQRYHQDIASSVCIVIDLRAGMRFGTRRRIKAAQAARLAVVLAAAYAKAGAEISALLLDKRPHWIPAAAGMAGAIRLADSLERISLKPEAAVEEPSLVHNLEQLLDKIRTGSRLHLISDFADLQEDNIRNLRRFNQRFEVTGWRIQDPAEQKLSTTAGLSLGWSADAEPVDTRITGTARINERLAQYAMQIEERLAQAGIRHTLLSPELDDLVEVLGGALH